MALPQLDKPTFTMTIPSSGKVIKFRPFVVREEKILLIAQQSDNDADLIRGIKQILHNCIVSEDFDVDSLTMFDLEYMFLKLRAKSVNNIVNLHYQDNEDEKVYDFDVNLDEVEVVKDPNHTNKIEITDTIGMIMKYPSVTIVDNIKTTDPIELMDYLIGSCVDKIYDEETVYSAEDYTEEELKNFLDSMDVNTYDKIRIFFDTLPKMFYELKYTNSKGTERTIGLTSLRDFFTWG